MPKDSTTPHVATDVITSYDRAHDWHSLNAMLNLYDKQGRIQFDKDLQAVREYVEKHVLPNTVHFKSTQDRLSRLIADGYYDESVFAQYDTEFLDRFYRNVDECGFEFDTFLGAFKFHRSYLYQGVSNRRRPLSSTSVKRSVERRSAVFSYVSKTTWSPYRVALTPHCS